ncbi:MAG: ABC transporter ATP-binding protein [Dermatophilaceae bacterium]
MRLTPERPTAPSAAPPPAGHGVIRADAVVKTYGRGADAVHALDGVSVTFETGRLTVITGPSGSGKSTLLHCVAGLDSVTAGRVWLGPTELTALSPRQLTLVRRDRMGFVFQAFNLLPMLTARENILLPSRLGGRRVHAARVGEVAGSLGLADRMTHRPSELSGGQQQRVAVARALLPRPEVVFADEPTGNLDSRSSAEVMRMLRESVDRDGQTVVMVTHDPAVAACADRVLEMRDGRLAGAGATTGSGSGSGSGSGADSDSGSGSRSGSSSGFDSGSGSGVAGGAAS